MLPPQLQPGLRQRSLSMSAVRTPPTLMLRGCVAHQQSRQFWGWKRQCDYDSHIDPMFRRFTRYRTLKTRAKLLDKLRRRGRWDWDVDQRPFFSAKQIRLAHHVNRPRWRQDQDDSETKAKGEGEDGLELSEREKQWKDQMEAMRKRIEQDPYEAVFGKRFEPFWSPLVPTWMREEMGLGRSPRAHSTAGLLKATPRDTRDPSEQGTSVDRTRSDSFKKDAEAEADSPNGQLTNYTYTPKKPIPGNEPESPEGQLTNYSYSSSTSWDSWTQKCRREEWDSLSGKTRRFEYDPITNRMVPVELSGPKVASKARKLANTTEDQMVSNVPVDKSDGNAVSAISKSVSVPVKMYIESRKAIPVPTETHKTAKRESGTSIYFPSLLNTPMAPKGRKPSPPATSSEKDLDKLTADEVRASVGKARHDEVINKEESVPLDLPSHRKYPLDQNNQTENSKAIGRRLSNTTVARQDSLIPTSSLQPALERMQTKQLQVELEPDDSAAHESTGDRMELKASNVPKEWNHQADLLQAARVQRTRGNVGDKLEVKKDKQQPRWIDIMNARKLAHDADKAKEQAAFAEQNAEKIARTKKAQSMLEAEISDQKLRMLAHETNYAHKVLSQAVQKLNEGRTTMSEVPSERGPFQQKTNDLWKELDATPKKSSVNAEMHVERINDLTSELEAKTAQEGYSSPSQIEKARYVQKIKSLREELDRTFKQSSVNAEMQVERIRELERELQGTRKPNEATKGAEATQAEGDFSVNVTKYAKDSSKWYKKPCYNPTLTGKPTKHEIAKAEHKAREGGLVGEIRDIYENRYGRIHANHRQTPAAPFKAEQVQGASSVLVSSGEPKDVKAELDVDLGKALTSYEKKQAYGYQKDDLEAELTAQETKPPKTFEERSYRFKRDGFEKHIAAQEKEAHEAQALFPSDLPNKARQATASDVQWEQPPVYKVLAYDSANDMFSTAATSSIFTGMETPISIPEALSQLYQPAKFVPHFAELQKEGFQVIHGTKDLLVLRKVKTASPPKPLNTQSSPALVDHGLVQPEANTAQQTKAFGVNPIDGTGYQVEPNTGSFASPTGFVGDRWDALKTSASRASHASKSTGEQPLPAFQYEGDRGWDHELDYPTRVRREERVFSGSRLGRRSKRQARDSAHEQTKGSRRKWKSWRSRVRWALGMGAGASVVAYGIGAVAQRKEVREAERWEQILEGKRARWE